MDIDPNVYKSALLRKLRNLRVDDPYPGLELNFTEKLNLMNNNEHIVQDLKESMRMFNTSIFIGAGGVASWFLPQYIKTIFNLSLQRPELLPFKIILYDNDIVEQKNLLRQNFIPEDVGKNKAEVLSERYNEIYPNIQVTYVDKYAYSRDFFTEFNLISELTTLESQPEKYVPMDFPTSCTSIFNFVDNEITKHQLDYYIARLDSGSLSNRASSLYFCTGCDVSNGQVFARKYNFSPFYTEYYKDVTFSQGIELIDEPVSCAELAELATVEQTFDSNSLAANLLNILVNNIMSDISKVYTNEIKFLSTSSPKVDTISDVDVFKYIKINESLSGRARAVSDEVYEWV